MRITVKGERTLIVCFEKEDKFIRNYSKQEIRENIIDNVSKLGIGVLVGKIQEILGDNHEWVKTFIPIQTTNNTTLNALLVHLNNPDLYKTRFKVITAQQYAIEWLSKERLRSQLVFDHLYMRYLFDCATNRVQPLTDTQFMKTIKANTNYHVRPSFRKHITQPILLNQMTLDKRIEQREIAEGRERK